MGNFPSSTIFSLSPFQPKRILILPYDKGEITLYVMDAKGYVTPARDSRGRACNTLKGVHFSGWSPPFENKELTIPRKALHSGEGLSGYPYCLMEAVFRLVPLDSRPHTAEVVALSFDGCQTFYWNELSKLPRDYAE